ncbi:asparagine synthase (glutamine-hydrolyzing) [Reichenbachiella sp.]
MCGIAGIIDFDQSGDRKEELSQMMDFLQKRGPEYTGYAHFDQVHLGHSRLSIIDLSAAANQPMSLVDGLCMVFNGEIYNYKNLKSDPRFGNVAFQTQSDTEVVLHYYKTLGLSQMLDNIDGMFAFGIYDLANQKVMLARDPFGKKPLYYYKSDKQFLFSSDIRSIWALKKQELSLNHRAIDYYLTELSSPQPQTIWNEIQQVPAGHTLDLNITDGSIEISPYFERKGSVDVPENINDVIGQCETLITRAILKRTVADVPIACFLSGGVDSGLVTAILAENSNQPIKTFTVGLQDDKMNEIPDARIVANHYGTDHEELIAESDTIERLPEIIDELGEPFADSSAIPTFMISQAIKTKVKVALSGDGGDEMFGGYKEYELAYQSDQFLNNYSGSLHRQTAILFSKLKSRVVPVTNNFGSLEEFGQMPGYKKMFRHMAFSPEGKTALYLDSFSLETVNWTNTYLQNIWDQRTRPTNTDQLMEASLDSRLVNDYLVKVDRMSMANSLEVRSPFLDVPLYHAMTHVPASLKMHQGNQKYILKKMVEKRYDQHIFERQKRGFGIPLHQWIKTDLKSIIEDTLLSRQFEARKLFDQTVVVKLLNEHQSGLKDHTHKIWALFCLEMWMQKFYDL